MTLDALDGWHGSAIPLKSLNEQLLNRFLIAHAAHHSPKTVARRKAEILAVWRLAADCGIATVPNSRLIRRVRLPRRIPEGFTEDELRRMFSGAGSHTEWYPWGSCIGHWWQAWIVVQYQTALRTADMLQLRTTGVLSGQWGQLQEKTGIEIVCAIDPALMGVIERLTPPERQLYFQWGHSMETLYEHWSRYVLAPAGIRRNRANGPQKLRRTAASWLERVSPGMGARLLGHLTPGLAQRHYLDPRITDQHHTPPVNVLLGDQDSPSRLRIAKVT